MVRKTRGGGKLPEPARAKGWTAYSRYGAEDLRPVIKAAGELRPTGFTEERPATEAEVEAELERRAAFKAECDVRSAFESRPDYRDAHSVRGAIEVMTHDDHPLDRLTPEEWRALREKLCGA